MTYIFQKKSLAMNVEAHSLRKTIRNMLRGVADVEVLCRFSGTGNKGKESFSALCITPFIQGK